MERALDQPRAIGVLLLRFERGSSHGADTFQVHRGVNEEGPAFTQCRHEPPSTSMTRTGWFSVASLDPYSTRLVEVLLKPKRYTPSPSIAAVTSNSTECLGQRYSLAIEQAVDRQDHIKAKDAIRLSGCWMVDVRENPLLVRLGIEAGEVFPREVRHLADALVEVTARLANRQMQE